MANVTLTANAMSQKKMLPVRKETRTMSHRVIGRVSRIAAANSKIPNDNQSESQMILRMFLLNICLTFALVVSLVERALTQVRSQLIISLIITVTAAVIAIVTIWLLSIGKSILERNPRGKSGKSYSGEAIRQCPTCDRSNLLRKLEVCLKFRDHLHEQIASGHTTRRPGLLGRAATAKIPQ